MGFKLTSRRWRCRRICKYILVSIYVGLVTFALLNFSNRCVYISPETLLLENQYGENLPGRCKYDFNKLDFVEVDMYHSPAVGLIEIRNPHIEIGGTWKPHDCLSWQKVAIIIPYRNRWRHIKMLFLRLHQILERQKIHYRVFLIEQAGQGTFNRGKLMNVGFLEALKYEAFDCFIFHDVDYIPLNDKNLYLCDKNVRHLASAKDETRYHVTYYNYAGGVVALNRENMRRINGFSNAYWGWGNEDDDFSARTGSIGLLISRPPEKIGRYKTVKHPKASPGLGNDLFFYWRNRMAVDGLNATKEMDYKVVNKTEERLYTNITVDIGKPPENLFNPQRDTVRESLFWFLSFYYP